jgi:HK97 family phage major capsid protein
MGSLKVDELYAEAHQSLSQAKVLMERDGALTEAQKSQIDAFLHNAEDLEKRAKALEMVLTREVELAAAQVQSANAISKARHDSYSKADDFKSFGEFMVAIYNLRTAGKYDPRLYKMEQKDLAAEVGISGGFLVPSDFQSEILTARAESSFVRRHARVVPMGSRLVPFPALDYSQGAAGVSAFFGGVRVYYVDENVAITESQPRFKQVELHARDLAGYCEIPNSLLRDSPVSIEAFLRGPGSFGGALGWQEDYDCIRGNGAGRPLGVLNSPAKLTVTRNTANDFKFVDAVTMKSKMLMTSRPVWVISQSVMPKVYSMVDAANNIIWLPNAREGAPETLLGYPIFWTEKVPALGTQGDVCLIDFGMYLLGDRAGITMDVDTSFKFQNNQTAFRAVESIDGQPWLANTITLADGTTVSPYVVLN